MAANDKTVTHEDKVAALRHAIQGGTAPEHIRNLRVVLAELEASRWRPISESHPPRHTKSLFLCSNGEIYQGTPCYGTHAPWWCSNLSLLKEPNTTVLKSDYPTDAPSPEAMEAAQNLTDQAYYSDGRPCGSPFKILRRKSEITAVARALDAFAKASRLRLKHSSYRVWLDKYLEAGVSVAPQGDDPSLVHSGDRP